MRRHHATAASSAKGATEHLAIADWAPAYVIRDSPKLYRLVVELPGVDKRDVHVVLQSGTLTIFGERHKHTSQHSDPMRRDEMHYGRFLRRFSLPADANTKNIGAVLHDDILDVVIEKSDARSERVSEVALQQPPNPRRRNATHRRPRRRDS